MRKTISVLALLAFAGGALLSLSLLGMTVHDGAGSPGCPLMPAQAVICTMTALDHIEAWQGMFAAIPQAAFMLLAAFVILAAWPRLVLAIRPPPGAWRPVSQESSLLSSPLDSLFARGIPHLKLY